MNTAYSPFSARSSAYGTINAPRRHAGREATMNGTADPRSIRPRRKYPNRPVRYSNGWDMTTISESRVDHRALNCTSYSAAERTVAMLRRNFQGICEEDEGTTTTALKYFPPSFMGPGNWLMFKLYVNSKESEVVRPPVLYCCDVQHHTKSMGQLAKQQRRSRSADHIVV